MREHNSRGRLLQCALRLFAEKGYEGASPNEIAEMAGVRKPTLYHFFGSKEGLFTALLETYYARLDEGLAACRYDPHPADYDRDVFPALLRVVDVYFRFAEEHADFYLMVLSMGFLPPSSATARISAPYQLRQYERLQALFGQVSAVHHNLRGRETECAWHFLALVNAHIGLWQRGAGALDGGTAASIVKRFLHGVFS